MEKPARRTMRVPKDVLNRTIRSAIEDVLLVRHHHGCRITRSRRRVGYPGPCVMVKLAWRTMRVPKDVLNRTIRSAIEDVLLVRYHHGCRITRSPRCPDTHS